MYSCGKVMLQLVFPHLRNDNNLVAFNKRLEEFKFDLATWRRWAGLLAAGVLCCVRWSSPPPTGVEAAAEATMRSSCWQGARAGGAACHCYRHPPVLSLSPITTVCCSRCACVPA